MYRWFLYIRRLWLRINTNSIEWNELRSVFLWKEFFEHSLMVFLMVGNLGKMSNGMWIWWGTGWTRRRRSVIHFYTLESVQIMVENLQIIRWYVLFSHSTNDDPNIYAILQRFAMFYGMLKYLRCRNHLLRGMQTNSGNQQFGIDISLNWLFYFRLFFFFFFFFKKKYVSSPLWFMQLSIFIDHNHFFELSFSLII